MYNKSRGITGICLGSLFIISLFFIEENKLIIPITDFLLARYFLPILIINCGLYLIALGIMNLKGMLSPYYSEHTSERDRSKQNLLSIIMSSPTILSLMSVIFIVSKSTLWKVIGTIAGCYIIWILVHSIKKVIGHGVKH